MAAAHNVLMRCSRAACASCEKSSGAGIPNLLQASAGSLAPPPRPAPPPPERDSPPLSPPSVPFSQSPLTPVGGGVTSPAAGGGCHMKAGVRVLVQSPLDASSCREK
jgi:hypothetical protein